MCDRMQCEPPGKTKSIVVMALCIWPHIKRKKTKNKKSCVATLIRILSDLLSHQVFLFLCDKQLIFFLRLQYGRELAGFLVGFRTSQA